MNIFFAVFVFMLIHIPGFQAVVYPGSAEQGASYQKENESITNTGEKTVDNWSILVEVNGEIVTAQALLKRYALYLVMSGYSVSYRERLTLNSYLEGYINELLLLQEAKKMGIRIMHDEIEAEKKRYLTEAYLTEKVLLKNLLKAGFTMVDADRYFEINLIINRFGHKKFSAIEISDEEAREYYSKKYEYYHSREKITASHILICHKKSQGCVSALTRPEAKGLAENIHKIAKPHNFSRLAKKYAKSRGDPSGGELGDIYRGTAVPSFEEAAFSLHKGEISDVVETDFGFHIIYVTDKQEARSFTFEQAKDSIKQELKEERIKSKLLKYPEQLRKDADINRYTVTGSNGKKEPENKNQSTVESVKAVSAADEFSTYKDTGKDICTNDKGQPIIMLFTKSTCSHCKWIQETFEYTAMDYVEMGLIEAHHYEMDNNDDLLTPDIETEIPQKYININTQGNPDGYVPYFNFGCKYNRIGTWYEKQDDLISEEMEMRGVLNALLR